MRKFFPAMLVILLFLTACGGRNAARSDKDNITGQPATPQNDASEVAPLTESLTAPPVMATPVPSPAALKPPAPKTDATRIPIVQPSRSLAGHDRFLVSRPFGAVRPADFELGLLFDRAEEPELVSLLEGLATALIDKNLKTAAFSNQGLVLAELLYNQDLSSTVEIVRIRYSVARPMPGAVYTVALRLFSGKGFSDGLVIINKDDEGTWLIEQLDLNLSGLDQESIRKEAWDPYGYSRNLLD